MALSYNKTWEVMHNLEDSFNRITTITQMVDDLVDAVSDRNENRVNDISTALKAYLPVYISQYDDASKRAWNNTVNEVRLIDNPYHSNVEDETIDYYNGSNVGYTMDYDEIVKFFEEEDISGEPGTPTELNKTDLFESL
tara:strand:+ start:320 stop:736 length:417 start_codon:yes stop_codon:yes gene_type:complete